MIQAVHPQQALTYTSLNKPVNFWVIFKRWINSKRTIGLIAVFGVFGTAAGQTLYMVLFHTKSYFNQYGFWVIFTPL
ncbi:MAG TPA: hypothetical protein VMR98_02655, partial [Candidatus Polarisedimenticolaceae bacterium]|nr:hypothetical protein [Candidatus Polarisedimenticolaceae bacterium]